MPFVWTGSLPYYRVEGGEGGREREGGLGRREGRRELGQWEGDGGREREVC